MSATSKMSPSGAGSGASLRSTRANSAVTNAVVVNPAARSIAVRSHPKFQNTGVLSAWNSGVDGAAVTPRSRGTCK